MKISIAFNRNNTPLPQKSKDVLLRISTGRNAKESINEYLNLKHNRADAKLESLLTKLLRAESSTQNNAHRTNYRQALVAIHECAQERAVDISRLVEVLPIEDLNRGIVGPHITLFITGTEPENYVEAINGFLSTINQFDISENKKTDY